MLETILKIYQFYIEYCDKSTMMILFVISLIYLSCKGKDERIKIVYPSLIMCFVVYNPLFYKYIWIVLLRSVYWRMMWMIPVLPAIAATAVDVITSRKSNITKIITALSVIAVIIMSGTNIYSKEGVYEPRENYYKIPQEAIDVAEAILEVDDDPVTIMPQSLFCYVRQYSAKVKQLYGRNGFLKYISAIKPEELKTFRQMGLDNPDYNYILMNADFSNCEFIIQNSEKPIPEQMLEQYGFHFMKCVSGYDIYQTDIDSTDTSDKWMISENGQTGMDNPTYYTIRDIHDRVLVIDSGCTDNKKDLSNMVESYDYHIDTWIFTSYSPDKIGAFYELIMEEDIIIDNVYVPDISKDDLIKQGSSAEEIEIYDRLAQKLNESSKVNVLNGQDSIYFGELKLRLVQTYDGKKVDAQIIINAPSSKLEFEYGALSDACDVSSYDYPISKVFR